MLNGDEGHDNDDKISVRRNVKCILCIRTSPSSYEEKVNEKKQKH